MVSKSIPKSYRHMFGVEPKRDAINEAYGKPNEYQYAANNEVHENNSTRNTNSGRSSSNASDCFYEHDNGATSSSSSSANNHDIFGVGQIPLLNATSTPRPKWAVRKYLPSIEGVHHEIYDLYKWLKPTAEEISCRRKVVNEIKSILLELWPDAAIIMFGSVATNSFLPSSDIDICVMPKEQLSLVADLKRVAESIRKSQNFENVAVLDKTAIPIIKCAHNQTQLRLDIIFNLKYVGQTVQWVQKMMYEFPLLEPLLLILKQFLAQRYLNNPFDGGLPSYALITMLVCFFDEIRRRNLKDLQHLDVLQSKTVRGKRPLGFLFIYFLEMFIDFDYVNNGIDFFKREKNGKSYSRSCITSKHRLAEKYGKDVYSNGFWISDPVQKGNNLGKGAHNILAIKSAFCDAYAILHNAMIQLAHYPEQIIEHYYYGPLTSLIINTEFNNRSANIESSRLILFGQLMEGKQQPNEEEAKNTSDEANLIEEHGTTVEDDSISTINDGDGIINNDDVVTKMKIE